MVSKHNFQCAYCRKTAEYRAEPKDLKKFPLGYGQTRPGFIAVCRRHLSKTVSGTQQPLPS